MNLEILSLSLSLVALAVAFIAWWRAVGHGDVRTLREQMKREVEELRRRQGELVESARNALSATVQDNRRRLERVREHLRIEAEEAADEVQKQISKAQQHLEELTERLERAARDMRNQAVTAAQSAEQAISKSVRRIEARVMLIQSRSKATLARVAAERSDFDRADTLLARAADLLRDARATLGDDRAFEPQLNAIRDSLHEATRAVRGKAENARSRIERVIFDTDNIVSALEADAATNGKKPS